MADRGSGGFGDYGARSQKHMRSPCFNIFINQIYSSSCSSCAIYLTIESELFSICLQIFLLAVYFA